MYKNQKFHITKSTLYVVPTPIGNLKDITIRALLTLKRVDCIIAENIYHTNNLLKHFSIKNTIYSYHSKNEKTKSEYFLHQLQIGKSIALVSNAGTPLINDPGYYLINKCRKSNIKIVPLPGPCASITALSASGFYTSKFCHEGFLPKKSEKRKLYLKELMHESRTLIFYESSHRILSSLEDMCTIWGPNHNIVLAREITKIWETIILDSIEKIINWIKDQNIRKKGEITIIAESFNKKNKNFVSPESLNTLKILAKKFSLKESVLLVSNIYKEKKNLLYQYAIKNNLNLS